MANDKNCCDRPLFQYIFVLSFRKIRSKALEPCSQKPRKANYSYIAAIIINTHMISLVLLRYQRDGWSDLIEWMIWRYSCSSMMFWIDSWLRFTGCCGREFNQSAIAFYLWYPLWYCLKPLNPSFQTVPFNYASYIRIDRTISFDLFDRSHDDELPLQINQNLVVGQGPIVPNDSA